MSRRPNITPAEKAEIVRLYVEEKNEAREIATIMRISYVAVYKHLHRADIKLRPQKPSGFCVSRNEPKRIEAIRQAMRRRAEMIKSGKAPNRAFVTKPQFPPHLQAAFEAEMVKVRAERPRLP